MNPLELNTCNCSVGLLTHCLYRNSGRSLSSCAFLNAVMVLSSLWNQKNASLHHKDPSRGCRPLIGTNAVSHISASWQKGLKWFHLWLDELDSCPKHSPSREHLTTQGTRIRAKQTQTFRMTGQSRRKQLSMEFLEAVPGPKESVLLSKASHFLLSPVTTSLPALWGIDYLSS